MESEKIGDTEEITEDEIKQENSENIPDKKKKKSYGQMQVIPRAEIPHLFKTASPVRLTSSSDFDRVIPSVKNSAKFKFPRKVLFVPLSLRIAQDFDSTLPRFSAKKVSRSSFVTTKPIMLSTIQEFDSKVSEINRPKLNAMRKAAEPNKPMFAKFAARLST
ncbi:MAG: hypothetical protein ACRDF4_03535, partial [Rhabdochlamydiaceae bacterium]